MSGTPKLPKQVAENRKAGFRSDLAAKQNPEALPDPYHRSITRQKAKQHQCYRVRPVEARTAFLLNFCLGPSVKFQKLIGCGFLKSSPQFSVIGNQFMSERGNAGAATAFSSLLDRYYRIGECLVHGIYQLPSSAVGHSHLPACC